MKNTFILFILLGIGITDLNAQWIQTDGPYDPTNLTTIIQQGSLIMSATSCGLFSKNDLSDRWSLNSALAITSHAQNNNSLFVGTLYNGIKLIDLNNPDNPLVDVSALSPNTMAYANSVLYAGTGMQGFFESHDNGISFENYNNGLPTDTLWNSHVGTYYETKVSCIAPTDNYIFCGTNKGVYRSMLSPVSWQEKNAGLPLNTVTLLENIDNTMYVVIGNDLYRSINNGDSWTMIYSSASSITSLLKDDMNLYISTSTNGIQYSTNNGSNWNAFNTGLTDLSVNIISKYDNTLICGTGESGFFQFVDNQWVNSNSGMICSEIRSMTISNNTLIANSVERVYKASAANTWSDISPNVPHNYFGSVASMNDSVFLSISYVISSWPYDMHFIVYSSDNGVTWNNLVNPVPFARDDPYSIYCNNGRLYAYEDDRMYYTDNLGTSWTDISLPSQYCNDFNDFVIYNSQPYAAACALGQVVKLDTDLNWELSNNGLPIDRDPLKFAYCDSALFTQVLDQGMYVSFDDGNYWTYAGDGLNTDRRIRGFAHYGKNLFVATENGIFATNDFGQNWYTFNEGLKNLNTSALVVLNDTLFAGTYGNGIWKIGLQDINVSISEINNHKSETRIYPNPARDFILIDNKNIAFENYKIIDLLGRQILSGKLNSNKVELQNIPNGTYILILSSREGNLNSKIIVNR